MRKFAVSWAGSRFEREMTVKEVTWETLKKKLATPVITSDTYAEYISWDKERQANSKDVAGYYLPGLFEGSIRHNANFKSRSTLSLDIDLAPVSFEAALKKAFGRFAYFWHTTRKHKPSAPRIRVQIPLTHDVVSADEFEALSRAVAKLFGFDKVDRVSFVPAQMTFWPSVSKDGEFKHGENIAPWLDPTTYLFDNYFDWTDRSEWPRSDDEAPPERRKDKAASALTKPGIIGAFCRAYSITRALEELIPGVYEPSGELRWRYHAAEGGSGAIIYDADTALYSNHTGHDPVAHQSVNAFDLCRIHMFGAEDEEASDDTRPMQMPSFQRMAAYAMTLPEVVEELNTLEAFDDLDEGSATVPNVAPGAPKQLDSLTNDAADPDDDLTVDSLPVQAPGATAASRSRVRAMIADCEDGDDLVDRVLPAVAGAGLSDAVLGPVLQQMVEQYSALTGGRKLSVLDLRKTVNEYKRKMRGVAVVEESDALPSSVERDEDGAPLSTVRNMHIWLAEGLSGWKVALDEFTGDEMLAPLGTEEWRPLTLTDRNNLRRTMEGAGFKSFGGGNEMLKMALNTLAAENVFDSAKNWLGTLLWDGVPRVEGFICQYFGVADSPYVRAVGRYWWGALAGRIASPGCKADMMLILVGKTGMRKSTAVESMAPAIDFFTLFKFSNHDDNQGRMMEGKLIGEIGELRGLENVEGEAIKAFLASRYDRWVPKYMERAVSRPRRIMFAGTTENSEFLSDIGGNRRFLPVAIRKADIEALRRDLPQLYAEGLEMFIENGNQVDFSAEDLAAEAHAEHTITDTLDDRVAAWLEAEIVGDDTEDLEPTTNGDLPVKISELMAATGMDLTKATRKDELRFGKILRRMDYSREVFWYQGKTVRGWLKKGSKLMPLNRGG